MSINKLSEGLLGEVSPNCQLVTLKSESGIALDGALFCPENPAAIVIHIHGSLGNFYQNQFIRVLADLYLRLNVGLLTINLRAHDGIAEGLDTRSNTVRYVGGSLTPFDSCIADIAGAIEWANIFRIPVILQGHSLGCDRVVAYSLERCWKGGLVLLSPCDSRELQIVWGDIQGVDWCAAATKAVNEADPFLLLPRDTYGVVGAGALWRYPIPISRPVFQSIMEGVPGNLFHLRRATAVSLPNNGYCYIGNDDELLTAPASVFAARVTSLLPQVQVDIIPGGHHDLTCSNKGWVCARVAKGLLKLLG